MKRSLRCLLMLALVCASTGCAAWPDRWGDQPCQIQTRPVVKRQPIWWHLFDVSAIEPVKRGFNLIRRGRHLLGVPQRSINLTDGELGSSTFISGRDPAQLSTEEVRWGPTDPAALAMPPFTITKPKVEGKTAGFFVTDAMGTKYIFKLDPADAPELLSGAEVVTSKLLYALGYHVPSYEIVRVRPDDFTIRDGVEYRDGRQKVPFTPEVLQGLLDARLAQGTVRVAASRILEGEILGPAPFKRLRDCAEIRALKVVYAWLNDVDAKDHNSLLIWHEGRAQGYLIDFGTSLGADAGLGASKTTCSGRVYEMDIGEAWLTLFSLGLRRSRCDANTEVFSPAVGRLSRDVNPSRWKPYAPNPAFHELTDTDARWIVRRMARLTREQIEAAVSAGQYSDPADAAYLTDTLIARRDVIVGHYLRQKYLPTATALIEEGS